MSFVFEADESVESGAQRLLVKELTKARECLKPHRASRAESIHDARKGLKKARALFRLIRTSLGETRYRDWNERVRDAGRVVSQARDAQVYIETFDGLLDHYREQLAPTSFRKARAAVRAIGNEALHEVVDNRTGLRRVQRELQSVLSEIENLDLSESGWKALGPNVENIYRRGRRQFEHAYAHPTDHAFHDWRKSVKYLRHQVEALRPCWREPMKGLCEELKVLGDLLGEDHDLAVLRELIASDPARFGNDDTVRALFGLIERRQETLRQQARILGEKLYVEKPRAFSRRLQGYWQAWHRPQPRPHQILMTA